MHAIKRQNAECYFQAALHGVDLNKSEDEKPSEVTTATITTNEMTNKQPLFGDPDTDYNHLSEEEKEEKTKQMMGHFKRVMSRTYIGGS